MPAPSRRPALAGLLAVLLLSACTGTDDAADQPEKVADPPRTVAGRTSTRRPSRTSRRRWPRAT